MPETPIAVCSRCNMLRAVMPSGVCYKCRGDAFRERHGEQPRALLTVLAEDARKYGFRPDQVVMVRVADTVTVAALVSVVCEIGETDAGDDDDG